MVIAKNYEQFIKFEAAIIKLNEMINHKIKSEQLTTCSLNPVDHEGYKTKDFEIDYRKYCLRYPSTTEQVSVDGGLKVKRMADTLIVDNGYIKPSVYQTKEAELVSLSGYELKHELVGPWLDLKDLEELLLKTAEPPLVTKMLAEETLRRSIVSSMDRYFVFNCHIKTAKNRVDIMYVYDLERNQAIRKYLAY